MRFRSQDLTYFDFQPSTLKTDDRENASNALLKQDIRGGCRYTIIHSSRQMSLKS